MLVSVLGEHFADFFGREYFEVCVYYRVHGLVGKDAVGDPVGIGCYGACPVGVIRNGPLVMPAMHVNLDVKSFRIHVQDGLHFFNNSVNIALRNARI